MVHGRRGVSGGLQTVLHRQFSGASYPMGVPLVKSERMFREKPESSIASADLDIIPISTRANLSSDETRLCAFGCSGKKAAGGAHAARSGRCVTPLRSAKTPRQGVAEFKAHIAAQIPTLVHQIDMAPAPPVAKVARGGGVCKDSCRNSDLCYFNAC